MDKDKELIFDNAINEKIKQNKRQELFKNACIKTTRINPGKVINKEQAKNETFAKEKRKNAIRCICTILVLYHLTASAALIESNDTIVKDFIKNVTHPITTASKVIEKFTDTCKIFIDDDTIEDTFQKGGR